MSDQITTLMFFRYKGFGNKYWAFKMMRLALPELRNVRGQTFFKLMGSGSGKGFGLIPDFSVYSLMQVWEKEEYAKAFFEEYSLMKEFKNRSEKINTFYLRCNESKGSWGQQRVFEKSKQNRKNEKIAVITRARIKISKAFAFWKHVPLTQNAVAESKGLIFTKGVGEIPFIELVTFSLWESEEDMISFAYKGKAHSSAMVEARKNGWFKEELFARFDLYHFSAFKKEKQTLI